MKLCEDCGSTDVKPGKFKFCETCRSKRDKASNLKARLKCKSARKQHKCKECKTNMTYTTHCNSCAQKLAILRIDHNMCQRCKAKPKHSESRSTKYCTECREEVYHEQLKYHAENRVRISKEVQEEKPSGIQSKFLVRGKIRYDILGSSAP